MNTRLPLIISVPHGGNIIAPETRDRTLLSREDIFSDGDPLTRELYDFRDLVACYYETTIARATIDLNRPPDAIPPGEIDGVVKSHTVTGKHVYRNNHLPGGKALRRLLQRYYQPYHDQLGRKSRRDDLLCGLDCHTMLDRAPAISDRPGQQRPFICLSNQGDHRGNQVPGRRLTCPPEMIRSLAASLARQFPEEASAIQLNDPFLGGYIIKRHSRHLPWIQIELNRRSYLSEKWFDPEALQVCRRRLAELRRRLFKAIQDFVRDCDLPDDSTEQAV